MTEGASQITSLTIVYSTDYSGQDQRKHQSSASLAFVRGIHRGPVNSPHKWPVTRKMFPFDEAIMMKMSCARTRLRGKLRFTCVRAASTDGLFAVLSRTPDVHFPHHCETYMEFYFGKMALDVTYAVIRTIRYNIYTFPFVFIPLHWLITNLKTHTEAKEYSE